MDGCFIKPASKTDKKQGWGDLDVFFLSSFCSSHTPHPLWTKFKNGQRHLCQKPCQPLFSSLKTILGLFPCTLLMSKDPSTALTIAKRPVATRPICHFFSFQKTERRHLATLPLPSRQRKLDTTPSHSVGGWPQEALLVVGSVVAELMMILSPPANCCLLCATCPSHDDCAFPKTTLSHSSSGDAAKTSGMSSFKSLGQSVVALWSGASETSHFWYLPLAILLAEPLPLLPYVLLPQTAQVPSSEWPGEVVFSALNQQQLTLREEDRTSHGRCQLDIIRVFSTPPTSGSPTSPPTPQIPQESTEDCA